MPGEASGPGSLEGEWTGWVQEDEKIGGLEGVEFEPAKASGPRSRESEWTGRVLDGMEIDELEDVEVGPGSVVGSEALGGAVGVAWSLVGG